ncbi:hypothetical protein GCM10023321_81240 [Pseudonocardia eucalypti]|uniref:Uncharacterized protein n=1 Tax=Pseudonocardia eucalypti TaxID=648755 RepID=A0ABP9RE79_9PSEU
MPPWFIFSSIHSSGLVQVFASVVHGFWPPVVPPGLVPLLAVTGAGGAAGGCWPGPGQSVVQPAGVVPFPVPAGLEDSKPANIGYSLRYFSSSSGVGWSPDWPVAVCGAGFPGQAGGRHSVE